MHHELISGEPSHLTDRNCNSCTTTCTGGSAPIQGDSTNRPAFPRLGSVLKANIPGLTSWENDDQQLEASHHHHHHHQTTTTEANPVVFHQVTLVSPPPPGGESHQPVSNNRNNSQCHLSPHQRELGELCSSVVVSSELGNRSTWDEDLADATQGDAKSSRNSGTAKHSCSQVQKDDNSECAGNESTYCSQSFQPYVNPHYNGDYFSLPSYTINPAGRQTRYVTELRLNLGKPYGRYSSGQSSRVDQNVSTDPIEADNQDVKQEHEHEHEDEEEEDECEPVKAILCRAVSTDIDTEDTIALSATEATDMPLEANSVQVKGQQPSPDTSQSVQEHVKDGQKERTKHSTRSVSFETNSNRQSQKKDGHVKIVSRKPAGDLGTRWHKIDPSTDIKAMSRLLQQLSLPKKRQSIELRSSGCDHPADPDSELTGEEEEDCSQVTTSTTATASTCTCSHSLRSDGEQEDTCPTLLGGTSIAKTVILRLGKTSRGTQYEQMERVKVLRDMEIQTSTFSAARLSPVDKGQGQAPSLWNAAIGPVKRTNQCVALMQSRLPQPPNFRIPHPCETKELHSIAPSISSCNSPSSFLVFTQVDVNTTERPPFNRPPESENDECNQVVGKTTTMRPMSRSLNFHHLVTASPHPVSAVRRSSEKKCNGDRTVALKDSQHSQNRYENTCAVFPLASDSDETNEFIVVAEERNNLIQLLSSDQANGPVPGQQASTSVYELDHRQERLRQRIDQTLSSNSKDSVSTVSEKSASKSKPSEDLTGRLEISNKDCYTVQEYCPSVRPSFGVVSAKNSKPFYKVVCEASRASEHQSLSSKHNSQGLNSATGSCSSCSCCSSSNSSSSTTTCVQESHPTSQGEQTEIDKGSPNLHIKCPQASEIQDKVQDSLTPATLPKEADRHIVLASPETNDPQRKELRQDPKPLCSNLHDLFNQVTEQEKRSILQRWLLEQVAHSTKQIREHSQEVSRYQFAQKSRASHMTVEATDSDPSYSDYMDGQQSRSTNRISTCTSEGYQNRSVTSGKRRKGDHCTIDHGRRSWKPTTKYSPPNTGYLRKATTSASRMPFRVQNRTSRDVPRRMSTSPRLGRQIAAQERSRHEYPRVHTAMDGRRVKCFTKAQQTSPNQMVSPTLTGGDRRLELTHQHDTRNRRRPFHEDQPEVGGLFEGIDSSRRPPATQREYANFGIRNDSVFSNNQLRHMLSTVMPSSTVLRRGETPCNRIDRGQGREVSGKVYELSPQDEIIKSHLNSADRRIKAVGNKNGCQVQITGPITTLIETPVTMSTSHGLGGRPRTSYQCHVVGPTGEKVSKCVNMLKDTFPRSFIRTCWRA